MNDINHTIQIIAHNPVLSSVSPIDGRKILPCLTFPHIWYRNEVKIENGSMVMVDGKPITYKQQNIWDKEAIISKGKSWIFHTGLLTRIENYCEKKDLSFEIDYNLDHFHSPIYHIQDRLPNGIILKPFQLSLIKKAIMRERGIIKSATGTGKTIMQIALCDSFYDANILILAHTKDIVIQTRKKLEELYNEDVQQIGGGKKYKYNGMKKEIIVSTIQSFAKIPSGDYADYFDVVMVDECHHVSDFPYDYDRKKGKKESLYTSVLGNIQAPIRLGFTATPPDKPSQIFACEGLLGPIIGEFTLEQATNMGVLAKPIVKIIKLPKISEIRKLKTYDEIYKEGIVRNYQRNQNILDQAERIVENGETCLIFVTQLEHGERLFNLSKTRTYLKDCIEYVRGATDGESREKTKEAFKNKNIKCVIATAVWTEGVDIPSLDAIIMASSEKSAKTTIQKIGRGLRIAEGKEKVIIYDFFDPSHNMLINHFGHRFSLYCDLGFIK